MAPVKQKSTLLETVPLISDTLHMLIFALLVLFAIVFGLTSHKPAPAPVAPARPMAVTIPTNYWPEGLGHPRR